MLWVYPPAEMMMSKAPEDVEVLLVRVFLRFKRSLKPERVVEVT